MIRISDRPPLSGIAILGSGDEAECFPALDRPHLGAVGGMLPGFFNLIFNGFVLAKSNCQLCAKWNAAWAEKIELFIDTFDDAPGIQI